MYKVRIRCISKNTGEVFYDFETEKFFSLDKILLCLDHARSVFFNRLMTDIKEDCTFEFSVIHFREELSLDFHDDVDDFNKTPVVF